MDLGIAGRVCVIAGATGGIGIETARLLRVEGAAVLLVARDGGRLAEMAEGLDGGDEEVATLPLDPTVPDFGEQMLAAAESQLGGIDILVLIEEGAIGGEGAESDDEEWRKRFELDLMAPLRAMKEIAPALADRGWGRIVNVGPATAASDAQAVTGTAALALTRLFADRYGKEGVLVNSVVAGSNPDGLPASDAEVAAEIVFLCSERAAYVSGSTWTTGASTPT